MRWTICELPERNCATGGTLVTTSDRVFVDAIALWDACCRSCDDVNLGESQACQRRNTLRMLPAVGAYVEILSFFRPQLFDGSDIMVFEEVDFYGLHRHSGRHGGDITREYESSDDLGGPVCRSYGSEESRNRIELLKFVI